METGVDDSLLPDPALKLLSRDVNKLYCDVCLKCWDKKNSKRAKLLKLNTNNFKSTAISWSKVDHEYNKIFARTNWENKDNYICSSCRPKFLNKTKLSQQSPLTNSTNEKEPCASMSSEQSAP